MTNPLAVDPDVEMLTTDNGLRVVCHRVAGAAVDYFGVVVDAGSRDDPDDDLGLAHFVEHTLFKGTPRRRSWHIINRMESCGGELNAYTTKESTTIYSVAPAGNISRSMELIADLTMNSIFPKGELDKEREVVADEINSYLDMPSEAVVDDFEDLIFEGTPLGHNILGNVDSVSHFDSATCRDYLRRHYVADKMVVFYSGAEKAERILRLASRYFNSLPQNSEYMRERLSIEAVNRFDIRRELSIHQSHTIMGARVFDMYDPRRFALAVVVNILGGPGMNSLLNVELRERRGLVYAVDASTSLLTDAGLFTVYLGCDPDDSARCRQLVGTTIDRLADKPLTERRLSAVLRQYAGQMTVASENRENLIMSLGRQALYRGRLTPRREIVERIRSLTADDLCDVARLISSDRLSSLTFC